MSVLILNKRILNITILFVFLFVMV